MVDKAGNEISKGVKVLLAGKRVPSSLRNRVGICITVEPDTTVVKIIGAHPDVDYYRTATSNLEVLREGDKRAETFYPLF